MANGHIPEESVKLFCCTNASETHRTSKTMPESGLCKKWPCFAWVIVTMAVRVPGLSNVNDPR
jgi:hypothetical protein